MTIKFYGRSKHTQKFPHKPIKQGFKIWAICERGYLYNFLFYSRYWKTGELEKNSSLPDTQLVVYQLARSLPPLYGEHTYTIYMDNLFTSTALFRILRSEVFGACGTTRPNSSADFPPTLQVLKEKYGDKLPWGTLLAYPVEGVLCLGWIDNNTVLSLSTIHIVDRVTDVLKRWRRRPLLTSSNAAVSRKPFEGIGVRAELEIPRYIDEYNYNMGGVDIADQHRAAFKTQRKALRNWLPYWYWMIDHAIINAFKIGVHAPGKYWTNRQHRDFRTRLYQVLFQFQLSGEVARKTSMLGNERLNRYTQHTYVIFTSLPHPCAWCSHMKSLETSRSRTPSPKKRCFGDEINTNIPTASMARSRRVRGGCMECRVYLCALKQWDCWWRWHKQEQKPPEAPGQER